MYHTLDDYVTFGGGVLMRTYVTHKGIHHTCVRVLLCRVASVVATAWNGMQLRTNVKNTERKQEFLEESFRFVACESHAGARTAYLFSVITEEERKKKKVRSFTNYIKSPSSISLDRGSFFSILLEQRLDT